jgi:RNA polymerase sigma-70 factor (ECF subfamily)
MILPDDRLVDRVQQGDRDAVRELVVRYHAAMLAVARLYARNRATAEEIVQDSWVAVLDGIGSFERRASLKTWLLAIVANKARSRAARDGRIVLFDDLAPDPDGPGLDPDRFDAAGHWSDPPLPWDEMSPERLAGDRELVRRIGAAIEGLPPAQRAIVLLRDVEGIDARAACNILGVSESNQRVLLHRARTRLRAVLETLLTPGKKPGKS